MPPAQPDGGSGKLKSREARSLQFDAPPIPKFLQSLHSQVHGSARSGTADDDDEAYDADELSSLLGTRGRGAETGPDEDGGDQSGEEWDGAQIVVLKDGKHITETEAKQAAQEVKAAAQAKQDSRTRSIATEDAADAGSASRPGAGLPTGSKRRGRIVDETDELLPSSKLSTAGKAAKTSFSNRNFMPASSGSMEDAKALIAAQREKKEWDQLDEKEKKLRLKEKHKVDKNKAAKKEKKKSGKGLSFDFQD